MATVRQTLALNDRMSPVLSKIINSMHRTLDIMEQIDVASERGIGANGFKKIRNDLNVANNELEEMLSGTTAVGRAANNAGGGFSRWQSAIVTANQGIQLIQQGIQGVNKLTGFFDGLTGISSRLNLITEDQVGLQDKIFKAAQRSRGEYTEMANSVAKLNLLASDSFAAFGGEDATVGFVETLNKAFVLSGAGTQERNSAMYQMTQALSSGRLQGDEYRSIIENAPLVAQSIEDYMRNVKGAQGTMKDWASEGLLTSDVIIAATQNAAEQINKDFEKMPMKFGDHMTKLKNEAIKSLAPLTQRFEGLMNSDKFKAFIQTSITWIQAGISWIDNLIGRIEQIGSTSGFQQFSSDIANALAVVIIILGALIQGALWFAEVVTSNWSWIGPIVWGIVGALAAYAVYLGIVRAVEIAGNVIKGISAVLTYAQAAANKTLEVSERKKAMATAASTAAQYGMNAAMLASPVTWIILALIALIVIIYVVINAINEATGSTISATGIILGALSVAGAFIWNLFLGIVDLVLGVINYLVNPILAFVNFFGNVFNDPVGSIIHLFGDMADNILGIIESIAKAIDKVVGSNLAGAVSGWREGLGSFVDTAAKQYGNGAYEEIVGSLNLSSESLGLGRWAYEDAWDFGYEGGTKVDASMSGIMDSVLGGFDPTKTPGDGGFNAEDYTGSGGNSLNVDASDSEVSLSDDDIKYLRDIAKLEYVNQYTTLRPVVQAQFGDVHETADVNEIITVLEDAIEGAYASSLGRG